MKQFVDECTLLSQEGITIDNLNFKFKILCIIADAPARNYLKETASYNGYHGCDRCVVKGRWSGRVIFTDKCCLKRNDYDFYRQKDRKHHIGISPLVSLKFPMVTGFPLDYMHLVCLGVTRKLLQCWVKGPLPHREGRRVFDSLSNQLESLRNSLPACFNRRPRSLRELDRWKATELRTFLLYTGPVVCRGAISSKKYENFLKLSVTIRILLSSNTDWYEVAKSLLHEFVSEISGIYSKEFLVYNVHSLVHLADDAYKYGSLENISAFPFENHMQELKRMLRSKQKHLAQIICRFTEKYNAGNEIICAQTVRKRSVNLSGNNCYVMLNGDIVIFKEVCSGSMFYLCQKFLTVRKYFLQPLDSAHFGIYKLSNLSSHYFKLSFNDVKQQLVLLKVNDDEFVCLPLCSSFN